MSDYIYDIETYPNVFLLAVKNAESGLKWLFEISNFKNDSLAIIEFLNYVRLTNGRFVGFNNLGFDYPVLHLLIRMGSSDAKTLYDKAQSLINNQDGENRWLNYIKPSDYFIEQIDLFKIHHFDNKARSTSLKMIEFNMRAESIEDLPFPVGIVLTADQISVLKHYNQHDVDQTHLFYLKSLDMIRFREELTDKYNRNFLNHNDTKIGKDFFIMELEKAGIACYDYSDKGRTPRQTVRPQINLSEAILPSITFNHPELIRVSKWLKEQVISETKGVFKDLTAIVNGFTFVFGTGGIHGSINSEVVESSDDWAVIDLDVTSYYPNIAIVNKFYPAHLGEKFVSIYKYLFEERKKYPKKSAESEMLKLALNGVYGDSNNIFSVFYDPLFTMKITLNGQLMLCMLAEKLMTVDKLRLLQVNTDGLTIHVMREHLPLVEQVCKEWQSLTGLSLEQVAYKAMMIRDVNSYIAVYQDGSTKRKGAYEYLMKWHQNAGGLVISKVAEKVLTENAPIRKTVTEWPDLMDFMLRVKVPRSSFLTWGDEKVQNTTRYYIAEGGKPLLKHMPPLKWPTAPWRQIGVESGWTVQVCNHLKDAGKLPVNYEYYIQEVEKLCLSLT